MQRQMRGKSVWGFHWICDRDTTETLPTQGHWEQNTYKLFQFNFSELFKISQPKMCQFIETDVL